MVNSGNWLDGELRKVGILFHPKLPAAQALAHELKCRLEESHISGWTSSAWDEPTAAPRVRDSDLLISIGGDGTVLRTAHLAMENKIPILGVNMGKLGFMNELSAEEARQTVPRLQSGWLEERAVLQAEIRLSKARQQNGSSALGPLYALNDVVVARGSAARVIRIQARIDGDLFTTYKGDGVIVATATGSTGYSMAAGGPILNPQSREFILNPVTSHLTIGNALVLPPTSTVELTVSSDHEAILSEDGQVERELRDGDRVSVTISPKTVRFLRFQSPGRFYSTVTQRLTRME